MSPYTTNGTNRQEDIQARKIASSAIARLLAQEAQQTTILVTNLIALLASSPALIPSVDDLWMRLQNNSSLRLLMHRTDANVDAFTQFSGWVMGRALHSLLHRSRVFLVPSIPTIHAKALDTLHALSCANHPSV